MWAGKEQLHVERERHGHLALAAARGVDTGRLFDRPAIPYKDVFDAQRARALAQGKPVDLEVDVQRIVDARNFIPLSAGGHTLEAYRGLPVGWSPAPTTIPTDLHMWQKFVAAPGVTLASGGRPTVVHLPASERPDAVIAEL